MSAALRDADFAALIALVSNFIRDAAQRCAALLFV